MEITHLWPEIRTAGEKLLAFNLCDIDSLDSSCFPSPGNHPQIESSYSPHLGITAGS